MLNANNRSGKEHDSDFFEYMCLTLYAFAGARSLPLSPAPSAPCMSPPCPTSRWSPSLNAYSHEWRSDVHYEEKRALRSNSTLTCGRKCPASVHASLTRTLDSRSVRVEATPQ